MVDDLSANLTSRFKLFWFRVVKCFQSCLLCNFQLLFFEYELRVIWDILGSIGIYFHGVSTQGSERQPIDRGIPAERSVQQMRIQQSQRRSDATRRLFKRSNFVEAQIRDVKISLDFEKISCTLWKHITYQIEERRKSFPTTYHTRNFDQ